jgi:hypothetical protein
MDFGFAKFDLNTITKRIELPEVSDPPLVLIVRCSLNRDYGNALFKLAQPPAAAPAPAPADAKALTAPAPPLDPAATRQRNAELYAGNVVMGWENVRHTDGEPVQFSPEACIEFLVQMMTHCPDLWFRVTTFVSDPANFRPASKTVDPVDLGKGLPRG